MNPFMILCCLSYLAIGLGHVAVGPVMEQLVASYAIDYETGGQLIMNQFIGFLAGVLLSPGLIRLSGRRNMIRLAFACFAAAEIGYFLEPSWTAMVLLALLAGFGFGMGETCIGALMVEVPGNQNASALSILELFFGIGALALPAAAGWLIAGGQWIWTFGVVAAIGAIVLMLWLFLPLGRAGQYMGRRLPTIKRRGALQHSVSAGEVRYARKKAPLLLLGALFFAIYVGIEMSYSNYLPAILGRMYAVSESSASFGLSLFWLAMSLGRLFVGRMTARIGYRNYLMACCACAAACFIGLSLMTGRMAAMALVAATGLSMAGIFAIALVYINEAFPGQSDRTTSILIACGGLGGAFLPKMAGWMLDRFHPAWTVWLIAGWAALLLAIMALISRERLRHREASAANAPF